MKIGLKIFITNLFILNIFLQSADVWAKQVIRVGYLPILDHLTLLVSHAKDNEAFQTVDIKPKLFKAWREMVGALKAEVIDAAFILSPLAMDLFNQGVPVKVILLAHREGSAITVKTGSNIQSAADLEGKAIAIPHRKATHTALLNHYLNRAHLSLQDVKTKVIAPPNMIKAMQLNKIDAFIVAEPFGAKAQHDGIGKILVLTKDILNHHVECIVIVRQTFIDHHRIAIQEWVNSLIRAGQWIEQDKLKNNSKKIASLTAKKYLPHSEQTIIMGLENPVDRISFNHLDLTLEDFQAIVNISQEANLIQSIDLNAFIDNSFYQNAPKK